MTRADVGRMLRADAFSLGLGALLVAVGVAAALLYVRSSRRREPSLPSFGLFAFLYGLRLMARTETFRLVFNLPPTFWPYLISAINYVIPLPALLFLRAAFPRWTASNVCARPSFLARGLSFGPGFLRCDLRLY